MSNDTLKFHNAIVKIDLYGKRELNLEDIMHIVPMNADLNVFRMSNAFVVHDLSTTLLAVDEMLQARYDYVAMIAMLASKLRSYTISRNSMNVVYRIVDCDKITCRMIGQSKKA